MNGLTSLRSRLIIVYVGLMVFGFGSLTLWSAQQVYTSTFADYGNTLNIYALLMANQLVEPMEYRNAADASALIVANSQNINADIAVFAQDGEFLVSSDFLPAELIADGTMYVVQDGQMAASAAIMYENLQIGTVQVSSSTSIPWTNIWQRWTALGLGFIVFLSISLVVTLRLIHTMTLPLADLRLKALRIARGDLSQRVVNLPEDEIGAVGRAFNTMIERVQALLNEQRAFASNASHELRTPLTTIRLRTEALQMGIEPELATRYINEIDGEVVRLGKLVDDLLLLSRLDARRMEIGQEEIDCVRMIESLERQYSRVARQKEIALKVLKPAECLLVQASLSHLQIVFRNVIDNALKYTPGPGEVQVTLGARDNYAVLTVVDSGRGIAPENLDQIGKRFYRTDKSRNRSTQGIGLGLALVGSILDLYHGTIQIDSEGVDQGTVVTVEWPLLGGGE